MRAFLFVRIVAIILLLGFAQHLDARSHVRETADSLLEEIRKTKDNDTERVRLYLWLSYQYQQLSYDTGILYGEEGLSLARSISWDKGTANCLHLIGFLYRLKGQYPLAIEYNLHALKVFEKIDWKKKIAEVNGEIGVVFQYQKNFDEALKYEKTSLAGYSRIGDKLGVASQLGDIATLYWFKYQFDSALSYDFRSLEIFEELGDQSEIARTESNIGMIYVDAGNGDKALEYNFRSLSANRRLGDRRSVGICFANIANACLLLAGDTAAHAHSAEQHSRLESALTYIDSAILIDSAIGGMNELMESLKSLSSIEARQHDFKLALRDYRRYIATRDSIYSAGNKIRIAKAEASHELELAHLALEKKKNERWFFLALIALVTFIGILMISRLAARQKRLLQEKEMAQNELSLFSASILEKNRILEQATGEIDRLRKEGEIDAGNEVLSQLRHSMILTDRQWEDFKKLFERAYPDYLANLQQKMPEVTQAEVRLLALTKLSLSSKEMAAMLGVSPVTIRIYRHRLRKKLNLDKDELIEEIVENI